MAAAGCISAPSCACLIVGETFSQFTQLSGLCYFNIKNGKVTVVLKGVRRVSLLLCDLSCNFKMSV